MKGYRCDLCGKFEDGNPSAVQGLTHKVAIEGYKGKKIGISVTVTHDSLNSSTHTFHSHCMARVNAAAFKAAVINKNESVAA